MSIKITAYIWETSKQTGSDLLMLLAIADHANEEGVCWPSLTRLAHKCRVSIRQAKNIVHKLEGDGELVVQRGRGRGHTSHYVIKGATEFTFCEKKVLPDSPIEQEKVNCIAPIDQKKVLPDSPIKKEKVLPDSPIEQEKVKSSTIKGEIAISPEPSLEPSEDLRYSLTTFESYPDNVSVAHMPGSDAMPSPLVTASSANGATKGCKKATPIREDEWPGLRTLLKAFDLPLTFLDDNEWWNALSYTCNPTNAWLERQFAKIHAWLNENPSKSPRSARGWKRFLRTWLERAYDYERRRPYATQKNSR